MISFLRRTTLLGILLLASPASALPLVGVSVGGDMVFFTQHPASSNVLGMAANARVNALGFDLSADVLKLADRTHAEARFNTDFSPIPMLSLKPGVGVANTDFNQPGTAEWAPVVGVHGQFSPILMPFSFSADASVAYPLTSRQPITRLDAGVDFGFFPFTSIHAGLKSIQGNSNTFMGPAIGLRVGL